MNNQILHSNSDVGSVVYYSIKVNGQIQQEKFSQPILAEQAKSQLDENSKMVAEVVPVTADGRQILMG